MRAIRVLATLTAGLLGASALPARAQRDKEPRRPEMPESADTNDANAYYQFGMTQLTRNPERAADAFYWSTRLNPLNAEALYARRCALLLADRYRFRKYMRGDRKTAQSREIRAIDSLYLVALTLNPFVSRTLEGKLIDEFMHDVAEDIARRYNVSTTEVRFYLDQEARDYGPSFQATVAYGEGRFRDALDWYAKAIKQAKYKAGYHADRGRLFFQMGTVDSALTELTSALEELRKADKKDIVYFYESKAQIQQSIAMAHLRLGDADKAKAAFGEALTEDLSYHPAHVQLAYLALDQKDTTTALNEMDMAVQIRADDPGIQYMYGHALLSAGRHKDAEAHLRKAIELDPVFAAPVHALAQSLEAQGSVADARAQYEKFLAISSKQDLRRAEAQQRIQKLAQSGQ